MTLLWTPERRILRQMLILKALKELQNIWTKWLPSVQSNKKTF